MISQPNKGSESQGRVLVGTTHDDVFVRVEGRGTHLNSQPLRECLLGMVDRGYRHFQMDLGECTYLDSTFLGVLANVCLQLRNQSGVFEIPRISARNLELFQTLGIDRFFEFGCAEGIGPTCSQTPSELQPLDEDRRSKTEWAETVLGAHRVLTDVDPRNKPRFKDVIEMIEQDLDTSGSTRHR